jgi:hypothetical protein
MPKKTVEKLEVKEIKTYQTSDGKIYDIKEAALEHERLLKNPEEWYKTKILELESEIAGLHITIERLEGKILALESKKFFPSQPHPDISPWAPYQQPFNPTTPTPKLPSEPGDVVYDAVELSKLSDEELKNKGYDVTYVGHKRAIIPHVTEFAFNKEQTNYDNATTPPDATPLEACSNKPTYMGPIPYEGYQSDGSVAIGTRD